MPRLKVNILYYPLFPQLLDSFQPFSDIPWSLEEVIQVSHFWLPIQQSLILGTLTSYESLQIPVCDQILAAALIDDPLTFDQVYSTIHEVPPGGKIPSPIIKQLFTPQSSLSTIATVSTSCLANWHFSTQGPHLSKMVDESCPKSLHSTYGYPKGSPEGTKFPILFQLDFSMIYDQTVLVSLTVQLWWAMDSCGSCLYCFGDLSSL